MKKYRIVKETTLDGKRYYIQEKWAEYWWHYVQFDNYDLGFKTYKEARKTLQRLLNKTKLKEFKDLQAGDDVFIGFEKKSIVKVITDSISKDYVRIHTSDGICYLVPGCLSFHTDCGREEEFLSTGKEAMIEHYKDKLRDLKIDYKNKKSHYEKWLKKVQKLK